MKTRVDAKNQLPCELKGPDLMIGQHTNHGDTHGHGQKQDVEEAAKVESSEDCLDQVAAAGKHEVDNAIFEHHLAKASLFAPRPEFHYSEQREEEVKNHSYLGVSILLTGESITHCR